MGFTITGIKERQEREQGELDLIENPQEIIYGGFLKRFSRKAKIELRTVLNSFARSYNFNLFM